MMRDAETQTDGPVTYENELLCFAQNRLDTLPHDMIVRLCSGYYSTDEIAAAKNLLYKVIPTQRRKITRIGQDKNRLDMNDILKVLLESPTKGLNSARFVASQLNKLPPVGIDNTDLIKLHQEIEKIQEAVAIIANNQKNLVETVTVSSKVSSKIPSLTTSAQPTTVVDEAHSEIQHEKVHPAAQPPDHPQDNLYKIFTTLTTSAQPTTVVDEAHSEIQHEKVHPAAHPPDHPPDHPRENLYEISTSHASKDQHNNTQVTHKDDISLPKKQMPSTITKSAVTFTSKSHTNLQHRTAGPSNTDTRSADASTNDTNTESLIEVSSSSEYDSDTSGTEVCVNIPVIHNRYSMKHVSTNNVIHNRYSIKPVSTNNVINTRIFTNSKIIQTKDKPDRQAFNLRQGNLLTGRGLTTDLRTANKHRKESHSSNKHCIGIFISRLVNRVTEEQVKRHILKETGILTRPEKLPTKFNSYSSFLVQCSPKIRSQLLNPDIWPRGALIKPFLS
jgi:hypothetical protein